MIIYFRGEMFACYTPLFMGLREKFQSHIWFIDPKAWESCVRGVMVITAKVKVIANIF